MIDLNRFTPQALATEPYRWAIIDRLFSPADGNALVKSFPRDHFKTVKGYDGEKGYEYEARSLIAMRASSASHGEFLSPAWQELAADLLSPAYRAAMSRLTGFDLSSLPIEVNVSHYGARAWLGPHVDLEDKIVSHILYFNSQWNETDGGCLTILRAADMSQVVAIVPPLIGNSVVLVRSQNSWHAVSRVRDGKRESRRSMTVTFYRPGSLSTMWPPEDNTPLHRFGNRAFLLRRWLRERWSQITS
jgi:hypothetical protein